MFDLDKLEFIGGKYGAPGVNRDRLHYSFVGIKRNEENGNLQFWLPLGFDQFDNRDFEQVKRFFFDMYKTFKRYIARRKYALDEEEIDNQRDGIHEQPGGFTFNIEDKEEVVLYSKLNAIDKILEGYDELKISSLAKKMITSSEIDYSKIYKYLHKAVYLEDDVAFLDEVLLKKPIVRPDHPPIVQLFCFIYTELKKEMNELDSVSSLATELANDFRESYLNLDSSLFDQDTYQDTIIRLKDILEDSLAYTPYKDEDFWHFFGAIEAFLYGENDFEDTNDVYWGISNFYDVWEDMCQWYMLKAFHPFRRKILYADIKGALKDFRGLTPAPFQLSLDVGQAPPRVIRPDLVYYEFNEASNTKTVDDIFEIDEFDRSKQINVRLKDESFRHLYYRFWKEVLHESRYHTERIKYPKHSDRIRYGILEEAKQTIQKLLDEGLTNAQEVTLCVIDYKYMSELAFHEYDESTLNEDGRNKVQDDIKKQLIYEWTLQQNFPKVKNFTLSFNQLTTVSEFWIPYYSEEEDDFLTKHTVSINNDKFNESRIKVYKVNFNTLQKFYVES